MRSGKKVCKTSPSPPAFLQTAARAWTASLAVVLCACTSSPPRAQIATNPAVSRGACIRVEALSDWEPLDDRSILLSAPGSPRSHLITLATPIKDLVLANELDVIDGDLDGFICPDSVDGIYVEECLCASAGIASIEYLSEKRTAELRGEPPTVL
jgi:hypothetical protein